MLYDEAGNVMFPCLKSLARLANLRCTKHKWTEGRGSILIWSLDMVNGGWSSRFFIISNPREIYNMIGVRAILFLVPIVRSLYPFILIQFQSSKAQPSYFRLESWVLKTYLWNSLL